MANLVTTHPTVTDATVMPQANGWNEQQPAQSGNYIGGFFGPVQYGEYVYKVLFGGQTLDQSDTTHYVAVYKSNDNFASKTLFVGPTYPARWITGGGSSKLYYGEELSCWFMSDGHTVWIGYWNGSGIDLVKFDMATDTYGTPFTGPTSPAVGGSFNEVYRIVEGVEGNFFVLYTLATSGSAADLWMSRVNGGTVGAPVKINTDSPFDSTLGAHFGGVVDVDGVLHCVYTDLATVDGSCSYRTVATDDTLGVPVVIGTSFFSLGEPILWQDALLVPGSADGMACAAALSNPVGDPFIVQNVPVSDNGNAGVIQTRAFVDLGTAWIVLDQVNVAPT